MSARRYRPEAEQTEPAVGPARHRGQREPIEGGAETTGGRAKAQGANDA
jgi:hypothetical protein